MPKLVGEQQFSFIPHQHGVDNAVIVKESVCSMRKKFRKMGWMRFKLDLEKAYDCINMGL